MIEVTWNSLVFATTLGIGMAICKDRGAAKKKDESEKDHPSFSFKLSGFGVGQLHHHNWLLPGW